MNESETRAELVDPKLRESGWGEVDGSRIRREFHITDGRIQVGGTRGKRDIADYILVYNNQKVAVVEAKSDREEASEGVAQAKEYAEKLHIDFTYATNGREIYEISMNTGKEGIVKAFPTPEQLWKRIYPNDNDWRERFAAVPFENIFGEAGMRFYPDFCQLV
ncbi:MAG: type I restriction enzyme HsdR N-terminal domain-containing protein [Patescibacteria group bacterium]